ncbi:MAG: DoxX family protein [Bacteroidetes bacterium]|nr:DoxX family protein [Bacteroidota bacterium]
MKYFILIAKLIIAFIFVQSLYFKFTDHAEAIHIFTTIGMAPWGRHFVGISELIVAIMLFVPKTTFHAALGGLGLMIGAIGFHRFTPLGIIVQWDGRSDHGQLFIMAVVALILSTILLLYYAPKDKKTLFDKLLLKG